MRVFPVLFLLLLFCLPAPSHDFPVYPVRIKLKAETRRALVEIRTNAVYWQEAVLGEACAGPVKWPVGVVRKAEQYINSNFKIFLDGKLIAGRLARYRCYEEPFLGEKGSDLFFQLEYPLEMQGKNLTVFSSFFIEYCEHMNGGCSYHSGSVNKEFFSRIKVTGAARAEIILPVEKPEYTFSLRDILVTPSQRLSETFLLGIGYFTRVFPFALLLVLFAVRHYPAKLIPVTETAVSLLLSGAGFLSGGILPGAFPEKILLSANLAALILFSAVIYFTAKDILKNILLFILFALNALTAAAQLHALNLSPEYFPAADLSCFTGYILAAAVLLSVIIGLLFIDEKYLFYRSRQAAERLFFQHLKFITVVSGLLSCYLLFLFF